MLHTASKKYICKSTYYLYLNKWEIHLSIYIGCSISKVQLLYPIPCTLYQIIHWSLKRIREKIPVSNNTSEYQTGRAVQEKRNKAERRRDIYNIIKKRISDHIHKTWLLASCFFFPLTPSASTIMDWLCFRFSNSFFFLLLL